MVGDVRSPITYTLLSDYSRRNGIRRNRRHGLGMDYCYGFHSVHCHVNGRVMLSDAHKV